MPGINDFRNAVQPTGPAVPKWGGIANGANVNGWVYSGNTGPNTGQWTWAGDPATHHVGEFQGFGFNPRTGQGYNPNDPQNAKFAQADATNKTNADGVLAQQNTQRTLELLRQQLSMGQRQGAGMLRQNLAQRGLMDSGSLGAGLGRLSENYGRQMSQGVLAASNNENDTLLRMREAEANRQQEERRMQQQAMLTREGYANDRNMARENKPNPWASLLGQGVSMLPFLAL